MKKFEIARDVDFTKVIRITDSEEGRDDIVRELKYTVPDSMKPLASPEAAKEYTDSIDKDLATLASAWDEAASDEDNTTREKWAEFRTSIFNDAGKLVKLYNSASLSGIFMECARQEKPMLHAVTVELYPTLQARVSEDKDTHVRTLEITTRMKRIPIDKLHKKMPGGIGEDRNWYYTSQAVSSLFLAKVIIKNTPNGKEADALRRVKDCYTMDDIARAIDMGKNPTSNTNMLKNLRLVVSQMIGEEYTSKVMSHDVNLIADYYVKEYKKDPSGLTKQVADKKNFNDILMIVCYRVVTDGSYDVYCKDLKTK